MRRLSDSGIFELFVPQDFRLGTLYKYEIKAKNGLVCPGKQTRTPMRRKSSREQLLPW
ncbi:MAG: hypothetical protein ACLR6B_01020 [Blautia sp.]